MNGKSIHQRTAFLIAGGLTAFTLVGLGALAGQLSTSTPRATATPAGASASETSAPIVNAVEQPTSAPASVSTDSASAAREAQYQALIQEANRRIQEANRRLAQMEQQLAEAQTGAGASAGVMAQAATAQSATPAAAISAQRALEIAQASAPGAVAQRLPELVSFQGTVAYEVAFNTGMVYVDASTGGVLYNGALIQPVAGPTRYEDDDDEDHERKEREHEEHEHEKREHEEHEHGEEDDDD